MSKRNVGNNVKTSSKKKKTNQGMSNYTKFGNKGGGKGGSTTSKKYKKRYRGQGR